MTGRLEQALRLKSHGFFFLVGIGSGGSRCDGSGGAQPHRGRGAQPHAWERPAGRGGDRLEQLSRWSKTPIFGGCSPYLDT